MSLKTRGILVVVVGTIMGLGLSLGGAMLADHNEPDSEDRSLEQARMFAEVLERVQQDYVEPIDEAVLLESAIRGLVSDLDSHSRYLDADEYRDIRISTTGSYSGVGLEISTANGSIEVVTPIDGTPAQRAGMQAGDRIVAIDGNTLENDGLQETINKMRGRAGSRIAITIMRGAAEEILVYSMRREKIQVASVRHQVLEPSYGYIRVSQFRETTAAEVSSGIDSLLDEINETTGGMLTGLVLDLRNNPGGLLESAVDVSDLFLDSGLIVTADGRTPESRFRKTARRGDILDGATMAVLVNKGSASASEIVAGALQDNNRALIVGTSTFGKGLVQTVMPLSKGRAIKLTTSRYYTPSGDSIHEVGITPDMLVEATSEHPKVGLAAGVDREGDEQLIEALAQMGRQRILQSSAQ